MAEPHTVRRLHRARRALDAIAADLTADELVEVLGSWVVQRSQAELVRGSFRALRVALRAVLAPSTLAPRGRARAERLAAVARGVHLRSPEADLAPFLRELAEVVEIVMPLPLPRRVDMVEAHLAAIEAPCRLVAAHALDDRDRSLVSRVAAIASTAGIVPRSGERARDQVRRALERW